MKNKSSVEKIEKRAGVFAATLLLAASVPAAIKGVNATNVHAASGSEPMSEMIKENDAVNRNDKQYQAEEAAEQKASDEGWIEHMKDDPSMVQDALEGDADKPVLNFAKKQEKKDKADGSWYSRTGDPSKYFAHGIHGKQAGYYRGHYMINGHIVSKATVLSNYRRAAKKYYAHHSHGHATHRHHNSYGGHKHARRAMKRRNNHKHLRRTKHLSYYAQGEKLGKYIHNHKDDNYGGVQYLLNNRKFSNRNFRNGYYKGYVTALRGDDENPKPRAKAAFKIVSAYQSSHNKMFKRGIVDGIKADYYGKPNRRYTHNKEYKLGFKQFSRIERFHD